MVTEEGDTGLGSLETIVATVRRIHVETDPRLDIFAVTLERKTDKAIWKETFGSERDLEIFLRGVKAGTVQAGWHKFDEPEIPREPNAYYRHDSGYDFGED